MPAYKDEKKGTWYVSFHYFDWTGKNVRKLKRGFATKRKAQEWEQSFLRTKAASMDMTFSEFFTVYEKDVRPKLKENTWWSKEHIIRTKIIPYFGNTKMVDVTVRDIIKWQNMMREYRDSEGKPYSPTYLKSVQAQLSCLFNHAVRFYELPSNPVHRAGALGAEEADEMLFWTKEESLRFIPTMANKPYSYYAFELLYPYLIARGNPMMLISIRKELKEISVELSRIDDASEIDEELFTPIRTMLEILESFKNDEGNNREDIKMSRVIICANQKGGVAKTTSVVNIGIGLSRLGKKVLVIDNDPQGSLTEALGYPEPDKLEITLATIMEWRHLLSVL